MESQRNWHDDDGPIKLWERVGITFIGEPAYPIASSVAAPDREFWAAGYDPPVSLDDYLVEHRLRADATSIDDLTVRQALMTLGLTRRAHLYPEWVCAEAWLFVALRTERRVTAIEILARAHDLGLSQSSIEQARTRLGVISTRQPGIRHGSWRWQLPPAVIERGSPGDIDPRWRRYQRYL